MIKANKKSTIFAIIVEITKIVRGKYTLVIRDAEPTSEAEADDNELANKFQGNKATNNQFLAMHG